MSLLPAVCSTFDWYGNDPTEAQAVIDRMLAVGEDVVVFADIHEWNDGEWWGWEEPKAETT